MGVVHMKRPVLLGGVAVLALLAAVLTWQGGVVDDGDEGAASAALAPASSSAVASAPVVASLPATTPAASAVSPAGLMADYRDSGGRSHAKHAGKRLALQGAVASVEAGENGLVLVSLDAGPDLPPARAVVAASDAARARAWPTGQAVALDCANQGLLMGEPLLADCRVVKD